MSDLIEAWDGVLDEARALGDLVALVRARPALPPTRSLIAWERAVDAVLARVDRETPIRETPVDLDGHG